MLWHGHCWRPLYAQIPHRPGSSSTFTFPVVRFSISSCQSSSSAWFRPATRLVRLKVFFLLFFDEKLKKKFKNKCTLVHKHPPLLLSSPLRVGGGQTKATCCHGSYGNLLANCCCCFLGDVPSEEVKIHSLLSFDQARVSFCAALRCSWRWDLSPVLHFLQLAPKASTGLFCSACPPVLWHSCRNTWRCEVPGAARSMAEVILGPQSSRISTGVQLES